MWIETYTTYLRLVANCWTPAGWDVRDQAAFDWAVVPQIWRRLASQIKYKRHTYRQQQSSNKSRKRERITTDGFFLSSSGWLSRKLREAVGCSCHRISSASLSLFTIIFDSYPLRLHASTHTHTHTRRQGPCEDAIYAMISSGSTGFPSDSPARANATEPNHESAVPLKREGLERRIFFSSFYRDFCAQRGLTYAATRYPLDEFLNSFYLRAVWCCRRKSARNKVVSMSSFQRGERTLKKESFNGISFRHYLEGRLTIRKFCHCLREWKEI